MSLPLSVPPSLPPQSSFITPKATLVEDTYSNSIQGDFPPRIPLHSRWPDKNAAPRVFKETIEKIITSYLERHHLKEKVSFLNEKKEVDLEEIRTLSGRGYDTRTKEEERISEVLDAAVWMIDTIYSDEDLKRFGSKDKESRQALKVFKRNIKSLLKAAEELGEEVYLPVRKAVQDFVDTK